MVVDMILFKDKGWTKKEQNEFMDEFIELVENFKGQAGGGINLHTEEEVDNMYE